MRIRIGLGFGDVAAPAAAADLSGAVGEYDFDVANVTKDGSSLIGQVNDLSGNARHLTQGTAGSKPLWVDSTPDHGSFDAGGGAALKRVLRTGMGAVFSSWEWTLAVITKCVTAPNANNQFNVFGAQNSANGRGGTSLGYYSTTATRRINMNRISDGAAGNATFGNAPLDTWELWVLRIRGDSDGAAATVKARVNGADQAVTGTTYANVIDANAAFLLGSAISNGNASVQFAKAWNRALSDASISSLEASLNSRFSLW